MIRTYVVAHTRMRTCQVGALNILYIVCMYIQIIQNCFSNNIGTVTVMTQRSLVFMKSSLCGSFISHNIPLYLQGNINWISSGTNDLVLSVTLTADTKEELDQIGVSFIELCSADFIFLRVTCGDATTCSSNEVS